MTATDTQTADPDRLLTGVSRWRGVLQDWRKLRAFVRRDLLIMLSYRTAALTDILNLLIQLLLFSFVSQMIDSDTLPSYGGRPATYLNFVTIGVAVTAFVQLGLGRLVGVIRSEQVTGTLELLLASPTSLGAVQVGSVAYSVLYVPLRTVAFLGLATALLNVPFDMSNVGPAITGLVLFMPVVWGLGVVIAAGILTFRRGGGAIGLAGAVLGAGSGAYFPLELLPGWLQAVMAYNPITITLNVMRAAMIGGVDWRALMSDYVVLAAMSVVSLLLGHLAFRAALRRELRLGTLNQY